MTDAFSCLESYRSTEQTPLGALEDLKRPDEAGGSKQPGGLVGSGGPEIRIPTEGMMGFGGYQVVLLDVASLSLYRGEFNVL